MNDDAEKLAAELLGLVVETPAWEMVELDDDWWFYHEPTPYDDTPPLED